VDDPRLLVAVDRPELEESHGQLAVRALPAAEDEDVHRAVHGLQVVALALVELHGGEHALGERLQMARDLEELGLRDMGCVDELVAAVLMALARVVLHQAADGSALRMEDGQPGTDLAREREQVELGPEPAVVAALGLLQALQMLGQRLLRLPGGAVDPLQLGRFSSPRQ
jgi:hypothetical protein